MSVAWISSGAAALAANIPAIKASPMLPAPMMAIFFPRAIRGLMLRMALGVEAHQLFVDQRAGHLGDLEELVRLDAKRHPGHKRIYAPDGAWRRGAPALRGSACGPSR